MICKLWCRRHGSPALLPQKKHANCVLFESTSQHVKVQKTTVEDMSVIISKEVSAFSHSWLGTLWHVPLPFSLTTSTRAQWSGVATAS